MEHDWKALFWQQSGRLADTLDEIDDEAFDTESLCSGWRVRDVMGHMLVGHTTPGPKATVRLAKYGFNVPKASFSESKALGGELSPQQIRDQWRAVVNNQTRKGIAKTIPYRDGFLDHFIHEQDIRRPLGRSVPVDDARLVAALDSVIKVRSPLFSPAKRLAGLRLEATDVDWTHGSGPLVRGPGEALVMAGGGRTIAADELEGDGVAKLRS